MPCHAIVIGGGLAGLAAATALAQRGVRVTVLESRPRLGGRASSFVDRTTGRTIDNCQHVSMGCCTNFAHFCQTTGLAEFLRPASELYFVGPDGRVNRFRESWLPAPLHLLPAFRRLSYLSRSDLGCLSRGLRALVAEAPAEDGGGSFGDWLAVHNQPPSVIERFWKVVLVSALSESLDRIDVGHARKVFVDGFLANRRGWEMQVPAAPLDELYGTRLTDWLTRHRAVVRLQSGVERLVVENETVQAVVLRSGERIEGDQFVLAVPWFLVGELLPAEVRRHAEFAGIDRLEAAPISSVHLWFDRVVTDLPHAVFVDRLSQWMFNRTVLQEGVPEANGPAAAPAAEGQYLQVVISASRELSERPQPETIAAVVEELGSVWPAATAAVLVHARVVTEHRAVFSVLPGVETLRPPQQSPIANLQVAGDYTRTGWPATMEGAVRSGYLAAENVLGQLGDRQRVLREDLRAGILSRTLLRGLKVEG